MIRKNHEKIKTSFGDSFCNKTGGSNNVVLAQKEQEEEEEKKEIRSNFTMRRLTRMKQSQDIQLPVLLEGTLSINIPTGDFTW